MSVEQRQKFVSEFNLNYDIEGYLGSGAFGTVYKCKQMNVQNIKVQEEIVAVKLVEFTWENQEKVWKEAELLINLNHLHIIKIHKSWVELPPKKYVYLYRAPLKATSQGVIFIETEYCNLESLRHWFRETWRSKEKAKILFYQITSGVKYLHDQEIIHRDLKPENILLRHDESSDSVIAKICDFGISRQIYSVMTSVSGTMGYMSPEVLKGDCFNKKSDIYALGVMFYEMLLLGDAENAALSCALAVMKLNEETNYTFQFLPQYEHTITSKEKSLIKWMVELKVQDRPGANQILQKLGEIYPSIELLKIPYTDTMPFSALVSRDENENVTFTSKKKDNGTFILAEKSTDKETMKNVLAEKPELLTFTLEASLTNVELEKSANAEENTMKKKYIVQIANTIDQNPFNRINQINLLENGTTISWKDVFTFFQSSCWNPQAHNALSLMSFFYPKDIPTSFVTKLMKKLFFYNEEHDVYGILEEHHMFQRNEVDGKNFISMDSIFMEVIQTHLKEEGQFLQTLDKILEKAFEMLKTNEVRWSYLIHVENIWKHVTSIQSLAEKYCDVPDWIAYQYSIAGKFKEGFNFCFGVLENLKSPQEIQLRCRLRIMHWKGTFHRYLEEYADAVQVQLQVYNEQKTLFGEDDEHTLLTAKELGTVYCKQRNLKEAKIWLTEALKKTETKYGREHTYTLHLKNNFALVLQDEGSFEEALKLLEEVLPLRENLNGSEHCDTLAVKHNIAHCKENLEKHDEALQIYEQVLKSQKRMLGKEHPETIKTEKGVKRTMSKDNE